MQRYLIHYLCRNFKQVNKRSAKKYIQYRIAEAVDEIAFMQQGNAGDAASQKKIDELIRLYELLIPEVNKVRSIEQGPQRKKHFNDIYARLRESIHNIISNSK